MVEEPQFVVLQSETETELFVHCTQFSLSYYCKMAAAEVGKKPHITVNPPTDHDDDLPPQPGRQRTQTPSVSGAEHSDTEENYVDEQVINRDKHYRTSIVAADLSSVFFIDPI